MMINLRCGCRGYSVKGELPYTTLGDYREDAAPHPWARHSVRAIDVALTRIRIGHTALSAHLHRIGMLRSPECRYCTEAESVGHVLLWCPRHYSHRTRLLDRLRPLGIRRLSLQVLIGARGYEDHRRIIYRHLVTFLQTSGIWTRV